MPHLCTLAFEFTYIGKENPTMTSMHYDNISKQFPSQTEPLEDKLKRGEIPTEAQVKGSVTNLKSSARQKLSNLGND